MTLAAVNLRLTPILEMRVSGSIARRSDWRGSLRKTSLCWRRSAAEGSVNRNARNASLGAVRKKNRLGVRMRPIEP